MARQAPIDVKLRAIDSVSIHRLMTVESLVDPAGDLYQEWSNAYVNYNKPMPAEYKIDLRQFHMPCESRVVNSHFGYRRQFRRNHYGTDIKGYVSDTIRAAFSGKVQTTVEELCHRMAHGDISIKPKKSRNKSNGPDACEYCKYNSICVFERGLGGSDCQLI